MKNIPIRRIADTHPEPPLIGSFSMREIKSLTAQKDLYQELHRHDFFFVLALEKGGGEHSIDFVPYKMSGNQVFFLRPGQVHQLTMKKGSRGFLLQFTSDFYAATSKPMQLLQQVCFKLSSSTYPKINTLLTALFTEYQRRPIHFEDVIKSYLAILFTELARSVKAPSDSTPSTTSRTDPQRYHQLIELVESNYAMHKNAEFYADQLHFTVYQLNALTRQAVGKTCSTLLQERVLLEAKRLLLATSLQVNEIAYQLGFEDPSYFIRFFRKHTGSTPDAFRKLKE